jgi:hypothetical protein
VDCSYQALAGLRLPDISSQPIQVGSQGEKSGSEDGTSYGALIELDRRSTLGSLFLTVCERFARLMRNRNEFSASSWANAARYTKVLLELDGFLERPGSKNHVLLPKKRGVALSDDGERSGQDMVPWLGSLVRYFNPTIDTNAYL